MESWIQSLDTPEKIYFVLLIKDGIPVSCCFLGVKRGFKHKIIYRTRAYLNETGQDEIDDLTIEYNSPLGLPDRFPIELLFKSKVFAQVEELLLSGVPESFYTALSTPDGFALSRKRKISSHFVDLDEVRKSGRTYLEFLSPNKRSQIKRSLKHFGEVGDVEISEATTSSQALAILSELIELHQKSWNAKGQPGAFASDYARRFHNNLVRSRFDCGEIQLLSISSNQKTIGCIYNFVYNGSVLYYQSGLNFEDSNVSRPGLVCHYKAINYNYQKGHSRYNFLAGDSQYKRSLSTNSDNLYYLTMTRIDWKYRIEKWFRSLKRAN